MELQHVNVKLLIANSERIDLEPLIPVFHTWIQDQIFDERLLDIDDYRHVHNGPGIILIGLEGDYSVDNSDGRLGIRYNRKAALDGKNEDRLKQALRAALLASERLESESSLAGKLRFNGQDIELFVNDRLLAPNTKETQNALQPDFENLAAKLFGGTEYSLSYDGEPRRLFSASIRSARAFTSAELLANL